MAGHTPGPWHYHDHPTKTAQITNSDKFPSPCWPPTGQRIADVWATDLECGEENARLISAAPDLLAACENLITATETPENQRLLKECATAAFAAVRKARGE